MPQTLTPPGVSVKTTVGPEFRHELKYLITAALILTMQSSVVISLGMVGALSIGRFRTAIKDPLDLMFLFWSISVGIICAAVAGFARHYSVKSRNVTAGAVDLVLELRTAQGAELVKAVNALEGVRSVCLMSHDGEVSF